MNDECLFIHDVTLVESSNASACQHISSRAMTAQARMIPNMVRALLFFFGGISRNSYIID
jgi:hypothetical protein